MDTRFPVLMYHGISGDSVSATNGNGKYIIAEEKFIAHLDEIHRQRLQVVPLKTAWSNGTSINHGPVVVLTFDDGLASHYEIVFPSLLREGMEADFFINPATIGKAGHLSWKQIAVMQRYGMSFYSHGQEHIDLTRLPLETLRHHLRFSKQSLEDHLGRSVEFLAAPYGLLNNKVIEVAEEEGYYAVCNSVSRPAMPGARSINRIAVYRHTPIRTFRQILKQHPFPYFLRQARSALLYFPKRILNQLSVLEITPPRR